jgi:ribosomal protein L12E/L44/L45/RPP1/RPP2
MVGMTLHILIGAETEARLRRLAEAAGTDVESFVSRMVEQVAAKPGLDELLEPLRKQFAASGTSDEQLAEEIAAARDAYRADKHKKSA